MKMSACIRRMKRSGLAVIAVLFAAGCTGQAQTPVTSGSPIPTTHGNWGQIMKVQVAKNGSVVFLDWSTSGLYQLRPGSSTFGTIASGSPLEASGTYWNSGLTMDAKDTIYIADRYGNTPFFRIPYNPADGTWDFTSANAYGATIGNGSVSLNTYDVAFVNSAAADGSGTLVVSTETSPQIWTVPVDNKGNPGSPTVLVKGLKARATHITADINGNVYFLEDEGSSASARVTGIFFIPVGTSGISGAGDGSAEAQLQRIDPASNMDQFSGITLDAAGNIYVSSQADSNGGAFNGDLMIPNTSGTPVGVNVGSFNFNAATFITPVQSSSTLAIDPRGYLWIPTSTSGWTPPGSLPYPGTDNVVLWQPGSASVGTSPVGTAGAPGTVFFNFSQTVTPASIAIAQPGTGSDFVASSTNPIADPAATTPQLPCTAGMVYNAYTTCPYFVSLNARLPGEVSGQVSLLDATGKAISSSTAFISGVGQGPDVALLVPSSQTAIGSGLMSPQQVAADARSYSYVADSSLGKVLQFAPGATSASTGVSLGTGLIAPTGVAVDGAGDVYIADSGKVIEIPFVNGALSSAGQVTLLSGLGGNLRLAADGFGDVFVADPANARVVKISNRQTTSVDPGLIAIGSGFTKPSALAVDSVGNLFVADGNSLFEIPATFDGVPTAITNSLAGPVTGLAIDPSGSIDVAQSGGIIRIPDNSGTLEANSAVALDSGSITAPNGIAIDAAGNLYVSDLTGGMPNLQLIGLGAAVNFGQVSPFVPSNPVDVDVFNIGNAPLTVMPSPTFSGTNGSEFAVTNSTQNGCDLTGATPVTAGSFCIVDLTLTASGSTPATRTGTMTLTSNAINAPSVNSSLVGTAVNNLEMSKVTLVVAPSTGISYPGSTVATVTVAPTVSTTTPTGQVILTLINQNAKLHQTTVLPAGTLVNGTVNFKLTGILGGTYTLQAVYHGDANFSGGLVTTTITVAQAPPTVQLSQPSNVTPTLGTYYVLLGSNTVLTASVSSSLGTPTGTITFLNGTSVADAKQNPVTLNANGVATFSTQNLSAGTYKLTAVYNGDQNFASLTSSVITFQVVPPSILITALPPTLSTKAGTAVSTVLTLQSIVGYSATNNQFGGVFIACDNTTVPQYSECTFNVPQVQVSAGAPGMTTLTLSSNLPVNTAAVHPTGTPLVFVCFTGLGLLGLVFGRRKRLAVLFGLIVLAGVSGGLAGCTNTGYTTTPPAPHVVTPSGTYNIRLYATDPNDGTVKTLPYTLTVTIQ
jgi:sugar lactone lactonase YvrE